jgi:YaiO family outer membrane protein
MLEFDRHRCMKRLAIALLLLPAFSNAQTVIQPQELPPIAVSPTGTADAGVAANLNRSISLGVAHQRLSNGYGHWNDQYMRLAWESDAANRINAEIQHGNRFGDSGALGGITWTHVINDDWFGALGYARTSNGIFWPIAQGYGSVSRKWLANRELIATLAVGADESRNDYKGRWVSAAASYYAPNRFVLGLGMRHTQTQPGDVATNRGFGSITWGERGSVYLSATYNRGREGYQLLNSTVINNFSSSESILVWKQWLGKSGGVEFKGFAYQNPFYRRVGVEAGIFADL